nr:TrkH family potassium uptake protein [uncultured Sellimonas sp.]
MRFLSKKLTQTQMIVYGYIGVILLGAVLLMLPISSKDGVFTPFLDCLFTATSASCVTGLIVVDTYQYWSMFGQWVILSLIQIGGLGFMTIGVFFAILLRRKIGLRTRGVLQESVNQLQIGGIVRLAKKILMGTLIFEGIGAVLLGLRFAERFGFTRGMYYGVFHSVSAFCNAGFDLFGCDEAYSSLTGYYDDWVVNLTIMGLIIVGGIGFFVWQDIMQNKLNFRQYRLHTKIVLTSTLVLIIIGAVGFYLLEKDNVLKGMSLEGQVLSSLFNSVTARTAGFNTTDTGMLLDGTKFLTIILMFIGGSPGSTAGGIKTTTLVVLLAYMRAGLRGENDCTIFHRRFDDSTIRKASMVLCVNLFLAVLASLFITTVHSVDFLDACFEVVSAIGTVGMSAGITREIGVSAHIVLIFLMFCGRIGSLTFALSLRGHKLPAPVKEPIEQITIG